MAKTIRKTAKKLTVAAINNSDDARRFSNKIVLTRISTRATSKGMQVSEIITTYPLTADNLALFKKKVY